MQLSFSQFLQESVKPEFWQQDWKTICFSYADKCPSVFLKRWREIVETRGKVSWFFTDESQNTSSMQFKNSSFLVSSDTVHWLGNLTKIPADISSYVGNQRLVYAAPSKALSGRASKKQLEIRCDIIPSRALIRDVTTFIGIPARPWQLKMTHDFFVGKKATDGCVDQLVRLFDYFQFASNPSNEQALSDYLPHLFTDAPVLFRLTDLFWQRKEKQFYALWDRLEVLYPVPFWITFWHRAIWKMVCYSDGSFKPAGFFNKQNAQGYTLDSYSDVLGKIYRIDCAFKQGKSALRPFEVLFIHHFK